MGLLVFPYIPRRTDDNNEAFSNALYNTELLHVLNHYSVCLFETDNRTEAFENIKRAAMTGKNPGKISLLILGGHGTPYSLNWGETADTEDESDDKNKLKQLEREQERYFSIFDEARFADMGEYIAPRGKIVLVSCSTGRDIQGENHRQKPTCINSSLSGEDLPMSSMTADRSRQ